MLYYYIFGFLVSNAVQPKPAVVAVQPTPAAVAVQPIRAAAPNAVQQRLVAGAVDQSTRSVSDTATTVRSSITGRSNDLGSKNFMNHVQQSIITLVRHLVKKYLVTVLHYLTVQTYRELTFSSLFFSG